MSAAVVYIRHRSGRQRLCSEAQLDAYIADGWVLERRVAVEAAPAKPAKKKTSKKTKDND
tara:strand:- start:528 stop:707 length:180 start_codon:yes stop_codon:yes gene_type:complete